MNPGLVQALREDARAVVDVELVAPAAVDVDAAQRPEVALVALDEPHRVVPLPLPPALGKHFARLEVERQAEAVGRRGIRVVGGRHAQVHDAVPLGHRQLGLLPHGGEEPPHAPVVQAATGGLRGTRRVVAPRLLSSCAVLRQLVQGVRPVVPVDEVEIRVTRMVGDRAPGRRVLHAVKHRAVAPGGFAEAAAVIARSERAELAVDERHELSRQIVGVAADRARVHVLVAAKRREAIGKNEDRRPHPALVDQSRGALGDVVAEILPRHMRQARARESHQIEQHREAASAATPGTCVVLGRKPEREPAHVRIAQRIVLEHARGVLERHDGPGFPSRPLKRHVRLFFEPTASVPS